MPSAKIYNFPNTSAHQHSIEFTGLVISAHRDGTGVIELRSPTEYQGQQVLYRPETTMPDTPNHICRPGAPVEGRVRYNYPHPGWNIETLMPFGGLGEALSPNPRPNLWRRLRELVWP